jgi:topoisomerase-4 subunit B
MGSEPGMPSVRTFVNDFVKTKLDNYCTRILQQQSAVAKNQAERERKELSGIRKH